MDRNWKNFDMSNRESINCLKEIFSGNINIGSNSGEGGRKKRQTLESGRDKEHSSIAPSEGHFSTDMLIFPWRMEWQSTQVFLAGKSHGHKNLVGYNP